MPPAPPTDVPGDSDAASGSPDPASCELWGFLHFVLGETLCLAKPLTWAHF